MSTQKNTDGIVSQMNRIDVSMRTFKFLLVIALAALAVVALGGMYMYNKSIGEMQSKIYVIDNGETFSAHAQDAGLTRKDEVRDHVTRFHELMFNVPPSSEMIIRNLNAAFEMADKSAYKYYNDLQETGFYKRLTSTNSYQQIEVTDVAIDMSVYPYPVQVTAYQYITRESNISKYTLVTTCKVANAVRSAKNLHGLMIEDFEVKQNNLVETRAK